VMHMNIGSISFPQYNSCMCRKNDPCLQIVNIQRVMVQKRQYKVPNQVAPHCHCRRSLGSSLSI
jgi:hypothetical protein